MTTRKIQLSFIGVFAMCSVHLFASEKNYQCTVTGSYYTDPSPGHPIGGGTYDFVGTGSTEEEAKQNAFAECKESDLGSEGCELRSCRELAILQPKPLGPDTEVSCATDSGLQIEIIRTTPQTYSYIAVISKYGTQVAAFGVQATSSDSDPKVVSYSSASSQYSMELDVPSYRFWVNGPNAFSHGTASCIVPDISYRPDPCRHRNCK
jgi:hypothetical protein